MTSRRPTRYSTLGPYLRSQSAGLAAILGLNAALALTGALQPWPLKLLVDRGLAENGTRFIFLAAAAAVGVFALSAALNAAHNWVWAVVGRRMMADLSADLFHKLQRRSLIQHGRRAIGDSLSRLSGDTWCLQIITATLVTGPAANVLSLAAIAYSGWRLDRDVAMWSLALAPVLAGSSLFFGRRLKQHARRGRETQARLMSFVQQTLSAIPLVQAFSREDFNAQRFEDLAGEATDVSQRRALATSAFGFVNGLITTTGIAIVLYVGGRRVLAARA